MANYNKNSNKMISQVLSIRERKKINSFELNKKHNLFYLLFFCSC